MMISILKYLQLLEPGGEIRIGSGAPGINFSGIRVFKGNDVDNWGLETYNEDALQWRVAPDGTLRDAKDNIILDADGLHFPQSGQNPVLGALLRDVILEGLTQVKGDMLFSLDSFVGSDDFERGLVGGGRGWGLRRENGITVLHIDALAVRRYIAVTEFLIQQIRAHNGTLLVTDTGSGKVDDFLFLDGTARTESKFQNL